MKRELLKKGIDVKILTCYTKKVALESNRSFFRRELKKVLTSYFLDDILIKLPR